MVGKGCIFYSFIGEWRSYIFLSARKGNGKSGSYDKTFGDGRLL